MFDPIKAADELRALVDPVKALDKQIEAVRQDIEVNELYLDDLRGQLEDLLDTRDSLTPDAEEPEVEGRDWRELAAEDAGVPLVGEL